MSVSEFTHDPSVLGEKLLLGEFREKNVFFLRVTRLVGKGADEIDGEIHGDGIDVVLWAWLFPLKCLDKWENR